MRLSKVKNLLPAPKDAEQLFLVVTPSRLSINESGNWKDSRDSFTVEVWKQKGNDDPTQTDMGDYAVHVFKNGSSTASVVQNKKTSFSVQAAKTDKSFDVRLKVGGSYTQTITVDVTQDGANGGPGGNTATVFLFRRSATPITAIDWTNTLTYTFATHSLVSVPSGWSLNKVPSGTDPVYVTAATAYGTGATDTIAASEWATPVLFVENGGQGEHGLNSASVFLYKRAASTPAKPTANLTYTFATGVLSGTLSGWTQNIPATDGNPCWVIQATAIGTGATDTIASSEWSKQTKLVEDGSQGTGIADTTWYYLATTMASGVTRAITGWKSSYQQATPDLPYVWRYGDTLLSDGNHTYTDCELIFSYSAGANANLLEQTNFTSLQALDKWLVRNRLIPVAGGTVASESYAQITTGTQAHNAYYDRTVKTSSQIQYKEVLQQPLWTADGSVRKLEPSTWYTLSFWAKGDGCATFIYPSVFDNASVCYVDGVTKNAYALGSDAYIAWTFSSAWKQHTFTFKTKSTIGDADQNLLFRLYPKSSSTASNCVYLCMPKLEVGMQATGYLSNEGSIHTGQPRRRRWAINTQYMAGGVDEPFDDVVLYGEKGFYHCIQSHISNLDNSPVGTYASQYWSSANSAMFELLATDIFFAEKALINNLIATLIQTGYEGSPHIEAEGSEFKIFGKGQYPAIYLAVNSDNKAVLRFQNENTGEFLYDLGPDGIMKEFTEVSDSYTEMKLKKLTNVTRVSEILNIATNDCSTFYRFNEGYKQIGSGSSATKQYHVSGTSSPSTKNAQFFTSKNYNGTLITTGWYVKPNNGNYLQMMTNDPNTVGVYSVNIYYFSGGKLVSSVPVYFKYTDAQHASKSVGCDENGNELSTSTYQYLYSYWQQHNITL